MDFSIDVGLGGWGLLIVGAVLLGWVVQMIGDVEWGFEWIVTALAAGIAALVASEFVVGWRAFEPVISGLAVIPALLAGIVVGVAAAVVTRLLTGGHFLRTVTA